MKRGGRIARRTRPRRKGGALFPGRKDPALRAFVLTQPCLLAWTVRTLGPNKLRRVGSSAISCFGATQNAHLKHRATGGADHGNDVPLCMGHHSQLDQHIRNEETFEALYDVNLAAAARRVEEDYVLHCRHNGLPR